MPNKWTEHIKKFAAEKGINYREAMKHPDCKGTYKKGSGFSNVSKQGRENEKLAEQVHNLKAGKGKKCNFIDTDVVIEKKGDGLRGTTPQVEVELTQPNVAAQMAIRRGRGRRPSVQAVQDLAGNWVIPAIQTFNEMLSQKPNHPSFQSANRIMKNAHELKTDEANIIANMVHTPLTPVPEKKGRGRGRPKKKDQVLNLGDSAYISVEQDTLGLGANAGKHYISL